MSISNHVKNGGGMTGTMSTSMVGTTPPVAASKPTVTVIVCTYNRIQWLSKCLRSLEEQDPHPDEIMVVDGPSNDGTREMLELLESKGDIVLVKQPKLDGISSARNLGLAMAKSDIVCYIDDDAIAQPGWLRSILEMYSEEDVGGGGGPVMNMIGELTMGKNAVAPNGEWFDESRGECTDGLAQVMVGCNMSFRRDALAGIGGFDPYFKYHQDETDACLGVLHAGYRILYHEGAVVWHEWCEGSYRKDRIKWYLRLRYMWGRNNSYLVRKHFSDRVGFSEYFGSRMAGFVERRVPRGIIEKHEAKQENDGGGMPAFFIAMGMVSETYGLLKGWRDGGHAR
ncbi:MAG: glycosyltransferase family 2 protein [Methanomassiliicoccus sp.]|nr:glycosyltransferase family 2 protein [Methanomassiliicoccus sp.]